MLNVVSHCNDGCGSCQRGSAARLRGRIKVSKQALLTEVQNTVRLSVHQANRIRQGEDQDARRRVQT